MWRENYFVNPIEKNLLRFHNFNVIEDITRAHVRHGMYTTSDAQGEVISIFKTDREK